MGFLTPDLPPADPGDIVAMPTFDRIRYLATHWVDYGFGTAKKTHVGYLVKVVIYAVRLPVATVTTRAGAVRASPPGTTSDRTEDGAVHRPVEMLAGRLVGPDDRPVQPARRRTPLLAATRHAAQPAVARQIPLTKGGVRSRSTSRSTPRWC
jgi:hypothetical protein